MEDFTRPLTAAPPRSAPPPPGPEPASNTWEYTWELADEQVEDMRREYLRAEQGVRSSGSWFIFQAVLVLLVGLSVMLPLYIDLQRLTGPNTGMGTMGPMELAIAMGLVGFFVCYTIMLFAAGWGLKKFKVWARWTGLFCAIPLIASVPVGTILAILIGRAMLRKEAAMLFSDEYREVRLRTPHIRYQSPRSVVILLIVLILLIAVGFVFSVLAA